MSVPWKRKPWYLIYRVQKDREGVWCLACEKWVDDWEHKHLCGSPYLRNGKYVTPEIVNEGHNKA